MKRLYRSRTDRWIAGVCGGLADYFGVDATAVRVAFVLLAFWQGFGVLIYVVLALLIPDGHAAELATETGPAPPPGDDDDAEQQRRTRLLGGLLIVGGAYVLLRNSPLLWALWGDHWVGALLVLGGLLVLLLRRPH